MKIFQGINNSTELRPLLKLGADEFYSGFYDAALPKLKSHCRTDEGLIGFRELKKVISISHENDSAFYVALNRKFYDQQNIEDSIEFIKRLIDEQVDGLIVASLPLLLKIKNENLPIKICLSTLQPVYNKATLDFFAPFNIKRIVFPEHVGAYEVEDILESNKMETEAFFWFSHSCANNETFCLFHNHHENFINLTNREGFHFCRQQPTVYENENIKQKWQESVVKKSFAHKNRYQINGLGNMYDFHALGLDLLKMGNRLLPLESKIIVLLLAVELIEILDNAGLKREDFLLEADEILRKHLAQSRLGQIGDLYR